MKRRRTAGITLSGVAVVALLARGAVLAQDDAGGRVERWRGTMSTPQGEAALAVELVFDSADGGSASGTAWFGDADPGSEPGQPLVGLEVHSDSVAFTLTLGGAGPDGQVHTLDVRFEGARGPRGLRGTYSIPGAPMHGGGDWGLEPVEAWPPP